MVKYHIDADKIEGYIKHLDQRRIIFFAAISLVLILIQVFIARRLNPDFPIWVSVIATLLISLAFYFARRLANENLTKLLQGQYVIDDSVVRFEVHEKLVKRFRLDEIAIIHQKRWGTFLVRGGGWTKINYIRPKRSNSYDVDSDEVIFIPTITANYGELVESLKRMSINAMKL